MELASAFGITTWNRADNLAKQITDNARRRPSLEWLSGGCIEKEIQSFCDENKARVNRSGRLRLQRVLSQQLSRMILKKLAKSTGIEMTGLKCTKPQQFIIHDYMNPWVLFDEHAGQIRHPSKDWDFWYSRPHREWQDNLIDKDDLIPDLVASFENEYCDWLEGGTVRRILSNDIFPNFSLYEVQRAT